MKKKDVYVVMWTEKGRREYGVPKRDVIVSVEPKEEIGVNVSICRVGRPRYMFADVLAVFSNKNEAEAYRRGNTDWVVSKAKIILHHD